jgi:hypothetical protein
MKNGRKIQIGDVKDAALEVVLQVTERALHLGAGQFLAMSLQPQRILDLQRVQGGEEKRQFETPEQGQGLW